MSGKLGKGRYKHSIVSRAGFRVIGCVGARGVIHSINGTLSHHGLEKFHTRLRADSPARVH